MYQIFFPAESRIVMSHTVYPDFAPYKNILYTEINFTQIMYFEHSITRKCLFLHYNNKTQYCQYKRQKKSNRPCSLSESYLYTDTYLCYNGSVKL